jgi:hypothetical protein
VVVVHILGAFLAFVVGGFYCCLQTYLSFKLPDIPGSSRGLRIARLAICVLDFTFMVVRILLIRLRHYISFVCRLVGLFICIFVFKLSLEIDALLVCLMVGWVFSVFPSLA